MKNLISAHSIITLTLFIQTNRYHHRQQNTKQKQKTNTRKRAKVCTAVQGCIQIVYNTNTTQHNTTESNIDEAKQTITSSPKSNSSKSPPKLPPPPKPNSLQQQSDYANIERIRASKDGDNDSITSNNSENNPFASLRFEPCVIDRFPPLDHEDTAIVSTDTQLQYFCLPTGLFLTKFPSLPIFYTFVWTPESGEHLYGCCLRFFEPVEPSTVYKFAQNTKNEEFKTTNQKLRLSQCKGMIALNVWFPSRKPVTSSQLTNTTKNFLEY